MIRNISVNMTEKQMNLINDILSVILDKYNSSEESDLQIGFGSFQDGERIVSSVGDDMETSEGTEETLEMCFEYLKEHLS